MINIKDKNNLIRPLNISYFFKMILNHKFEFVLLLLTMIGLILKFFYFLRIALNSDSVLAGLMTIEFSKYHNYFFSYYYVPAENNYIFDVVVFHLLPQILSNYDPIMLKIVAFSHFLLIVVIFSCIIFLFTKNLLNTLFFSALLSNWYTGYGITSHESTIFMIGILLILYLFKPVKNWEIIFLAILTIITVSDGLILIWFTIPILFSILVINLLKRSPREQIMSSLKFGLAIVILSSIVMIFKKFFVEYYIGHSHIFHCKEPDCLINTKIPMLLKDLPSSLSSSFHRIENGQTIFIDILFIIFLIAYTVLLIKNFRSMPKKDTLIFLIFIGIMLVVTSLFYLTTGVPGTLRYLKFILICILSIFCLVDFNESKYTKWFLLSIIIINLICVVQFSAAHPPNQKEYQLIDFLKKSNLSFGYGEYWDSNIITYLSCEDITIRPIRMENGLVPLYWNSAKRWYENPSKKFFVIVRDTNKKALNYYHNNSEPIQIIDYKNYKIFEYDLDRYNEQGIGVK